MNIPKVSSDDMSRIEKIDIRLNSYDKTEQYKSVSPKSDVINLNDYYNLGYKSDEQNQDEAQVIRDDVLSRYDIEENDENKDEKLTEIYSEILNNQDDNSPLIEYCTENEIEMDSSKVESDEFNSGIETAMAHMSHDGSGVGDEIKLGNVDLSQYVPETLVEDSAKNRIIINDYGVFEFDDEIKFTNNGYVGTIKGNNVRILQTDDGSCDVKYYDKRGRIFKEMLYTPDRLITTAEYNQYGEIESKYTSDESGNIISEYQRYDGYSLETFNTDQGGYIMYDADGNLQYNVSKTENENGTLSISSYGDKIRSQELTNDVCFKYPSQSNEQKYKFSTGNRYTIEFISDGNNNITATASRGSLKGDFSVTRNDNGTFSVNDKIYLSLDEVAAELNNTEIEQNTDADKEISVSKQGFGVGDCGILSAINALSYTEMGREVIDESLQYNDDGSLTINFYGINRAYTITKDEIENTDYFASGDKDMIAIEIGLNKAYSDVVNGNLEIDYDYAPYWCKSPYELTSEKFLITANWPQGVFYFLSGKECSINDDISNSEKSAWLDELQYNQGIAISCGTTRRDGSSILRTDTESTYVSGITVNDAFGNPVGIVSDHAYAIKEVNTKADGTRTVTIVNPWDSGDEIVINEQTYLDNFDLNYSIQLRDNQNFPIYYYL